MIIAATDASDPRLDAFRWRERQLATRAQRSEHVGAGLFVAEGDLVVERALAAKCEPVTLLCEESLAQHFDSSCGGNVSVFTGSADLRKVVTGLGVPLDVVGLFRRPPMLTLDDVLLSARRVLVLEEVDNPTNVGAIMRSAAALGWDAVVLDPTSADPLARRALRVSMGTALSLRFCRHEATSAVSARLRDEGFVTVGLSPDSSADDISRLSISADKIALYFGAERTGLSSTTMDLVDHLVRIPMHAGVDSLNVGAAAAIALYEFGPLADKRRRH